MHVIHAYNKYSKSARALADKMKLPLDGDIIQLVKGSEGTKIINWGHGNLTLPGLEKCKVFNKPGAICVAVNKLLTFQALTKEGVSTVPYTQDLSVVNIWRLQGRTVIVRTLLEGHDGAGAIVVKPTDVLPMGKVYTPFIPNCTEYRVNVAFDRTVGVQKKVPMPGKQVDPYLKTTGGGYGLCLLDEDDIPHGIRPVARAAVKALGLDFGGVDLLRAPNGKVYVLEVNTAPELTPSMVDGYAKKFEEALKL